MNVLSFDLEEWYVYTLYDKGPKEYYLPILNRYLDELLGILNDKNIKSTFFCLGMVAKTNPEIIQRIAGDGHEIGCHSHAHKFITQLDKNSFRKDTITAIKLLEDITGKYIHSYRAPAFTITEQNKWALEVLAECGITRDCSIFPTTRSFGGFPSFGCEKPSIIKIGDFTIKEFPINTARILGAKIAYSGGGYFRLVPYKKIKTIVSQSDYVMSYFHIRDFDAYQKRVISLRYFQSYYGIKHAFEKLKQFILDFDFINVKQADELIDWNKVPIIEL